MKSAAKRNDWPTKRSNELFCDKDTSPEFLIQKQRDNVLLYFIVCTVEMTTDPVLPHTICKVEHLINISGSLPKNHNPYGLGYLLTIEPAKSSVLYMLEHPSLLTTSINIFLGTMSIIHTPPLTIWLLHPSCWHLFLLLHHVRYRPDLSLLWVGTSLVAASLYLHLFIFAPCLMQTPPFNDFVRAPFMMTANIPFGTMFLIHNPPL